MSAEKGMRDVHASAEKKWTFEQDQHCDRDDTEGRSLSKDGYSISEPLQPYRMQACPFEQCQELFGHRTHALLHYIKEHLESKEKRDLRQNLDLITKHARQIWKGDRVENEGSDAEEEQKDMKHLVKLLREELNHDPTVDWALILNAIIRGTAKGVLAIGYLFLLLLGG